MSDDSHLKPLARAAMAGAFIMLAHQVAAKAARDALFLSYFSATDLPKMVGAAAVVAMLGALMMARFLVRSTPASTLLTTLGVSAVLHIAEFLLIPVYAGPVVVFTYLHIIFSGSIALSLFWSIANEQFSPGEAKRFFGRITAAGTVGGITGGLLAERVATAISLNSLLVLLGVLHALSLGVVIFVSRARHVEVSAGSGEPMREILKDAVAKAPFLKSVAMLILFTTLSTQILDFLFKSSAAATYGKGPELARFFALFYTATQAIGFVLQATVTPVALRNLGLGKSVMALPFSLTLGGLFSLWTPILAVFTGTRGSELVLKNSLFRAGYEIFFTPIPAHEKRAVKTAIDVVFDRLGEFLAAGLIQGFLMVGLVSGTRPLLLFVVGFGAVCIWISARMDRAYLHALEQGLLHRAIELEEDSVHDSTTLSVLMRSMPGLARTTEAPPATKPPKPAPEHRSADPALDNLRVLRSGVAGDVRRALSTDRAFDPLAVPQVIRLLAWDEVTSEARRYLEVHSERILGQLADALTDRQNDFSVRRRIPRILAQVPNQRVVEALHSVLDDPRFEIRFQTSRALEYLNRSHPELTFHHDVIMQAVERDLSVSRTIWDERRLLRKRDDSDAQFDYLDEIVKDHANQSLEHVFSLLAIILPKDPLKVAFRALHSDDHLLRGLGLEYLETALPDRVFKLFRAVVDPRSPAAKPRPSQEVVQALMASRENIRLDFKTASGDVLSPTQPPPQATPK